MTTIEENTKAVGSSAYWGKKEKWFIVLAVHRDSGVLDRSNFTVARDRLLASAACREWQKENDSPVDVIRFGHWAVGWVDYLVVNPACADVTAIAEEMQNSLADYPVLDEMHYSALEHEEADQVWRACYRPAERVKWIRAHQSQCEFQGFADLLGAVRGNYFPGYASEILQ